MSNLLNWPHWVKVYGVALPFARVGLLSGGPSIEFSWAAVARVVAAGGAFTS